MLEVRQTVVDCSASLIPQRIHGLLLGVVCASRTVNLELDAEAAELLEHLLPELCERRFGCCLL